MLSPIRAKTNEQTGRTIDWLILLLNTTVLEIYQNGLSLQDGR
jgi:hypothetical protein